VLQVAFHPVFEALEPALLHWCSKSPVALSPDFVEIFGQALIVARSVSEDDASDDFEPGNREGIPGYLCLGLAICGWKKTPEFRADNFL